MKRLMIAVRDSAAAAFNTPFCAPSTGLAIRSFRDEVNRKADGNLMNTHPEDFELYQVGEYDEDTGTVIPCEHVLLARGKDCVESLN